MRTKSWVLVLTVVSACGDGDIDIDTDANNVCGEIAEVACHNMYQCCSEGEIEDFLGVDEPRTEAQCRDDVRKLCDRAIADRDFSIEGGRSRFDAQIMNTCLNALVAPEGVCATIDEVLPWTAACMNEAWTGLVSDGSECLAAFECESTDSFCAPNQRCTALPRVGQPCPGNQCAANLFCSGGTCQTQLGEGGQCMQQQQCQPPLFCDFNRVPAVCTARGDGGDPCTSSAACKSFQCIPGTCAGANPFQCFEDLDCNGRCADDNMPCTTDSQCQIGACSVTTTTQCTVNGQCPGVETCVFPVRCLPGDCVGDPVCTSAQITADYCTGALNDLPIP